MPNPYANMGSMESDGLSPNQVKARAQPQRFLRQTTVPKGKATTQTKSKKVQKSGRASVKKPAPAPATKRYLRPTGTKSQQYNFSRKVKPEVA